MPSFRDIRPSTRRTAVRFRRGARLFLSVVCAGMSYALAADDEYKYIVTEGYDPVAASLRNTSSAKSSGQSVTSDPLSSSSSGVDLESRYFTAGTSAGTGIDSSDFGFYLIVR